MRVVVAGEPKSATTSLFYGVANALPPNATRFFEPLFPVPSNADDRSPVIAKILIQPDKRHPRLQASSGYPHDVADSVEAFEKKIHIVRDPRDRVVSLFLWMIRDLAGTPNAERILNVVRKKESSPDSVDFSDICLSFFPEDSAEASLDLFLRRRVEHAIDFIRRRHGYFRLTYEQYVRGDISDLEAYLGLRIERDPPLPASHAIVRNLKTPGAWKRWFTEQDVAFFRERLHPLMTAYGIPEDWTVSGPTHMLPRHGSEYVASLLRKKASSPSF